MFTFIIILTFTTKCLTAYKDSQIVLKLTPDQVAKSVDKVISDSYLQEKAKDLALKAAGQFVKALKDYHHKNNDNIRPPPILDREFVRSPKILRQNSEVTEGFTKPEVVQDALESKEALLLLETPEPDGDHLESAQISEDENEVRKPLVIKERKINGIRYT